MTATAAIIAPITRHFEHVVEKGGYDSFLDHVWDSIATFAHRIVDPHLGWLFWLAIGGIAGVQIASRLRRLEETSRGRLGGPSFWYIRCEARLIRWAIIWPWLRHISSDIDQDLADLNHILTTVHGFPNMPAVTFSDPVALAQTSKYLRLVLPNLNAANIDEARDDARNYLTRISV